MTALIYIFGFLIGAAVFLYFLSVFQSGAEKISSMKNPDSRPRPEPVTDRVDTGGLRRFPGRAPGTRMCPLCGSELTRYEALYASRLKTGNDVQILIYGCRYCYKPEENAETARSSDI